MTENDGNLSEAELAEEKKEDTSGTEDAGNTTEEKPADESANANASTEEKPADESANANADSTSEVLDKENATSETNEDASTSETVVEDAVSEVLDPEGNVIVETSDENGSEMLIMKNVHNIVFQVINPEDDKDVFVLKPQTSIPFDKIPKWVKKTVLYVSHMKAKLLEVDTLKNQFKKS